MKLFGGGKPEHPLADPKEAKRLLDALPTNDPVKALDELMHWVESVVAAEGFKPDARIQLLVTLDDVAQPFVRKLAKDYFTAARPSRFQVLTISDSPIFSSLKASFQIASRPQAWANNNAREKYSLRKRAFGSRATYSSQRAIIAGSSPCSIKTVNGNMVKPNSPRSIRSKIR